MKNNTETQIRAYNFAKNIIALLDQTPKDYVTQTLGKQLIRSATSIGANIIEAHAASSKKDFTNFLSHALKSANETKFWLGLLRDTRDIQKDISPLLTETHQLANILGASIHTLRTKKS